MIFSSTVPAEYNTCFLLDYLSRRFTYLSVADWRGQIDLGRLTRNDEPCRADTPLRSGDVVAFTLDQEEFPEPAADLAFRIVYEDDWLLGIDKPGNLLVHRQGRSLTHNLVYQLRYVHQPPYPEAGVVNRLDRETSGVILLARRPECLAALNALFAKRQVRKSYLAVVRGVPVARQGVIDAPIGRAPESLVSYRYCAGPLALDPKAALTRYQVVSQQSDRSLVRLQPETGRTHQLRVHLAHIGHPIMGDKLYGCSDQEFVLWRDRPLAAQATVGIIRQALHAESLRFVHPWTGREVVISAAMPTDMDAWLKE